jgi:hypothetical protein
MSWCDKLASTPAVGFGLNPNIVSSGALLDAFSPKLSPLITDEKARFSIDQTGPHGLTFTTEDGFQTAIDANKIAVTFVHRLSAKQVSGGPPQLELLSLTRPYTELLPMVCTKLIEDTLTIPNSRTRSVHRVGIVTTTAIAEEEAPPGIIRFLDYMRDPWGTIFPAFSFNFTSELDSTPHRRDVCNHTVIRASGLGALLNMSFDWQRSFMQPRPMSQSTLEEIVLEAEEAALAYFEELAQGNRFDVDLNSKVE